ncbi:hypothetical protein H4582DRAFT_2031924 [Lactarius indigo]|nr:hypothetical protein H4582DRAFT_2031924 [Lactarius indigo]
MLGLLLLLLIPCLCSSSSFQEDALLLGLLRCSVDGDDCSHLSLFALEVRLIHHLDLLDHALVMSSVVGTWPWGCVCDERGLQPDEVI